MARTAIVIAHRQAPTRRVVAVKNFNRGEGVTPNSGESVFGRREGKRRQCGVTITPVGQPVSRELVTASVADKGQDSELAFKGYVCHLDVSLPEEWLWRIEGMVASDEEVGVQVAALAHAKWVWDGDFPALGRAACWHDSLGGGCHDC